MDSIDLALTLLTIAPIFILGIWYVTIESFAGSDQLIRIRKSKNLRSSVSSFNERFITWSILTLIATLILTLTWERLRPAIFLAAMTALSLGIFQRNREKQTAKLAVSQIELELPQVIQTICLLVSAGISPTKSLEIISRGSSSMIAREFKVAIKGVAEGLSAVSSLDRLLTKTKSSGMRRFLTTLIVSIERGTPLVPVLISLARDSQAEWRTELLKRAGRAEIGLMIPVVFLLLPLSVLFALFPSILELQSL